MVENSKIEWTDHTFNPWVGCTKISPACDHCYAETWARRTGQSHLWNGQRQRTSERNWKLPIKWNREAQARAAGWQAGCDIHGGDEARCIAGGFIKPERPRVFCASLADVFDNQAPPEWRRDLFDLIQQTPALDWQLLTKRPQNIAKMIERDCATGRLPANVWLGTTVENQKQADVRIPDLLRTWASLYFISGEPLLDRVSLAKWLPGSYECASECGYRSATAPAWERCNGCGADEKDAGEFCSACGSQNWSALCPDCSSFAVSHHPDTPNIGWVIAGGESGPGARPAHPKWASSLRDECKAAGIPFFFKQWGEWAPVSEMSEDAIDQSYHPAPKGNPEGRRASKYNECVLHENGDSFRGTAMHGPDAFLQGSGAMLMIQVGKKAAGAKLAANEWREMPDG